MAAIDPAKFQLKKGPWVKENRMATTTWHRPEAWALNPALALLGTRSITTSFGNIVGKNWLDRIAKEVYQLRSYRCDVGEPRERARDRAAPAAAGKSWSPCIARISPGTLCSRGSATP